VERIFFTLNMLSAAIALVLATRKMFRNPKEERWEIFLAVSGLMFLVAVWTNFFLTWCGTHYTARFDLYAYRLDKMFGEPSFMIGRYLLTHMWLDYLAMSAYYLLFSVTFFVVCWYFLTQPLEDALTVVRTFLITPVSELISLAFPMSGPFYAFKGFPWRMPDGSAHVIQITAPPNCMPSDHLTMALLILYFSRRWYPATLLATFYLFLVELATLGSGEHYMIDLIAAVPFTCFVVYLGGSNKEYARRPLQATDHGCAYAEEITRRPRK
jgi:hypothetical protein